MLRDKVVLVDRDDKQIGLMDKLQAHIQPAQLHRAISVLLFNAQNQLLLQQRAEGKPLWPGFWSNTVCTHPFENEGYLESARRRLKEEMGIDLAISKLSILYRFEYRVDYNQELAEHELDTVIVGRYSGRFDPNPREVAAARWLDIGSIKSEINSSVAYSPWFQLILKAPQLYSWLS